MEVDRAVPRRAEQKFFEVEDLPLVLKIALKLNMDFLDCLFLKNGRVFDWVDQKTRAFPAGVDFAFEREDFIVLNFVLHRFPSFREESEVERAVVIL